MIDQELIDLYMDETKQPEHVVRSFLSEGREPPSRERTDRWGFSFKEVELLDKYATKLPPV